MSSKITFLNIILQNKNDFQKQKLELENNKELINTPFEDSNQGKTIHSPLTYCIENNLEKMTDYLIENGADVNYKIPLTEDYPIHLACRHRSKELVKKLLERKDININSLNKKTETCFSIAMNNCDANIYSMLIDYNNNKKIKIETRRVVVSHNSSSNNLNNNVEDINTTTSTIINNTITNNNEISSNIDVTHKDTTNNNNISIMTSNNSEKMSQIIRKNNIKKNEIMKKSLLNNLEVEVSFKFEDRYLTGKVGKFIFIIIFYKTYIYEYRLLFS